MSDQPRFTGVAASRKRPLSANKKRQIRMETNMIKSTLIATTAALSIGVSGALAENYKVEFSYAPDASAQEIYAGFKDSANLTCARELRRDGRTALSIDHKLRNTCSAELVESAVNSLGQPQVTALHRNKLLNGRGTELAQAE